MPVTRTRFYTYDELLPTLRDNVEETFNLY